MGLIQYIAQCTQISELNNVYKLQCFLIVHSVVNDIISFTFCLFEFLFRRMIKGVGDEILITYLWHSFWIYVHITKFIYTNWHALYLPDQIL